MLEFNILDITSSHLCSASESALCCCTLLQASRIVCKHYREVHAPRKNATGEKPSKICVKENIVTDIQCQWPVPVMTKSVMRSHNQVIVSHYYEIASHIYEITSHYCEIVSDNYEIASHYCEIAIASHIYEIVSHYGIVSQLWDCKSIMK
jgi:hypothetical protein